MQLTAIVLNAGLGDLSIGLEMAGFHIVAAYESDAKSIAIHEVNLKTPVYKLPLDTNEIAIDSKIDLVAAHIYQSTLNKNGIDMEPSPDLQKLLHILEYCRPHSFFLLLNASATRNTRVLECLRSAADSLYQIAWKKLDIAKMTGFPVKENTVCVVGTSREIEREFQFPEQGTFSPLSADVFLHTNTIHDDWYYEFRNRDRIAISGDYPFACWNGRTHQYESSSAIQWNYVNVPLVRDSGTYRKITHREIANLKGFPHSFFIPDTDRQRLYRKLMYSGNVNIIKQIAGMISYSLSTNPWRHQTKERGLHFEEIFRQYLKQLLEKEANEENTLECSSAEQMHDVDFVYSFNNGTFYIETKCYSNNASMRTNIADACKRLSSFKERGIPILAVANTVPSKTKDHWSKQGVFIWDLENLLWLFDEFPNIKNEFVASLLYSVEEIIPKSPEQNFFKKAAAKKHKEPDLKERLLQIPPEERLNQVIPGREQFALYEKACTDILKYLLGDYLTLWDVQTKSNDGLFRFDLCCKIKNGTDHDFFDTVKNYFHSKYIVFEFKNYKEKITQKEIFTTQRYLYRTALRNVAIIVSRVGADEHAQQAAEACLREDGKLILCISDNALLDMINIKTSGSGEPADFLMALLDDILIHLGK